MHSRLPSILSFFILLFPAMNKGSIVSAADKYDNPDTIIVAKDGTGEFRTITDAIEVCRAFMTYHKVIAVKRGVYKEKLVIPSWLSHIEICGEDCANTIITYDDHANLTLPGTLKPMGTFRTYTLKIEGSDITIKNITIENNAPRKGQAVALHTEGTRLLFINCRFLGNQDTIFTGSADTYLFFHRCYIEGTTDFIFGPSTAWFEQCLIKSKADSYITAASTPQNTPWGYVFNRCTLIAAPAIKRVFLGRPWRPYAFTLFINCHMGSHICPEGWHNWGNSSNEQTARYLEYNNSGAGADVGQRARWTTLLREEEAQKVTVDNVFNHNIHWIPRSLISK